MDKIYVLAGSYIQAVYYAQENDITKEELVYINNERDLRGIDGAGKSLVVHGTAYQKRDYHYILRAARHRRFEIKFIGEAVKKTMTKTRAV